MKRRLLLSFLAAIACVAGSSFGQTPSPAPTETPAATPPAAPFHRRGITLTPDERSTLLAAGKKAQQDPAVKAAREKMDAAMKAAREAMVAKDKSLAPLFDKVEAASSPGAPRPHFTAGEAAQLRAARDSILGTPEADALQKAEVEYRAAVRQAMIASDPNVAPILDRLPDLRGETGITRPPLRAPASPAPSAFP